MGSQPILALLAIGLFAGASFYFALAETALFSLGRWQGQQLLEKFPRTAPTLTRLLSAPQDLLSTIVLGNTISNSCLVATALWMALDGKWPIMITLPATLLLILIGCEVIPKTLAVRLPEQWAVRVARPMAVLLSLSGPLRQVSQKLSTFLLRAVVPGSIKPLPRLTEAEYQELLDLAHQKGTLAQTEKEIILQIISLDQKTVAEVMRPRSRMHCIPDDLSVEEMIARARQYRHRRLPIYDGDPDTIVGVLDTRVLLLNPQVDLADAIEFPSFVPETMNLFHLLKSLQRQRRGMALVLDEFGGTAGLITMEDILSELIGRLSSDTEPAGFVMERLGEGRWRVSGTMRLEDFRREYPPLDELEEVDTMGGLLVHLLEVVPQAGQSATFRGLRLTAQQVDERHVQQVLVEVLGRKGGV